MAAIGGGNMALVIGLFVLCLVGLVSILVTALRVTLDFHLTSAIVTFDISSTDIEDLTANQSSPRVLHQVWLNYTPVWRRWKTAIERTRKINRNHRYRLWTSRDVETLLTRNYPWFLKTYHGYPYDVQRADAAKYFILHRYGGVYMDMDLQTKVKYDVMLAGANASHSECLLAPSGATGISPDLIMCKRDSRFMQFVTSQLEEANHRYLLPYLTVIWSTGTSFFSRCLHLYPGKDNLRILTEEQYAQEYLVHVGGSSWYAWDGRAIYKAYKYCNKHIDRRTLIVGGLLLACCLSVVVFNRRRQFRRLINKVL